jgi:hypothetical protein
MRKVLAEVVLVSVLASGVASAGTWEPPTDAEWERLPAFCMVKKRELAKTDPNALQTGVGMIGPQFQNAHHFCWGLNFLYRYYNNPFSPKAKTSLASAKNEFDYMAEHLLENSSLAGDVFLYRGTVNALMKNDSAAASDLQQAITRSPGLVRAYLALADFYIERKQRDKALETVTEGLRHAPDSKGLKRRYKELGGKLPYPEPIIAQPEPEKAATVPAEGAGKTEPSADANPAVTQGPASNFPADKAVSTESTPRKGFCRFCPDEP